VISLIFHVTSIHVFSVWSRVTVLLSNFYLFDWHTSLDAKLQFHIIILAAFQMVIYCRFRISTRKMIKWCTWHQFSYHMGLLWIILISGSCWFLIHLNINYSRRHFLEYFDISHYTNYSHGFSFFWLSYFSLSKSCNFSCCLWMWNSDAAEWNLKSSLCPCTGALLGVVRLP
jgi:hypothetical protein